MQVRLFTEEVDKITSLVIGLSSRLAKASLLPANGQQDEKLQVIEDKIKGVNKKSNEGKKLFFSRKLTCEDGESPDKASTQLSPPC